MLSNAFPLIKVEDTSRNQNSEYGIDEAVQRNMANGNTQFAVDMARQMKISFSIPTIALQIVSRFYHLRCYINYDRFMIIVACMVLAFKLRYMEFRFKDVVFAFYQVMCFKNNISEPFDEKIHNRIKDQICVAQNEILRTLEYDIDVTTPHDYLAQILHLSFPGQSKTVKVDKIRITARILILDSNRVQTSLYFSPLVICIASLLIACRYEGVKPYAAFLSQGNTDSSKQKSDQQLYSQWLECIGNGQKQKIKQQDILECIKHMNKVIKLIAQT